MSQNKNFASILIHKITAYILGFILTFTLFCSFSPLVMAQSTTPLVVPVQSISASLSSVSGKPLDLCSGDGSNFIPGACFDGTDQYATGDGKTIITNLTTNIVSLLIFIGAAIAVLIIVLGGYKLITSNGDDKTAKEGRDMVVNALIGLIILGLSFTLVTLVVKFVTGLNIGA